MDPIKETSKIGGIRMYKYGLSDDDIFGRTSLEELYKRGRIKELDYKAVVMSSSSILLEDCYWDSFPTYKSTYTCPSNYTPKGYIRKDGRLINLKHQRNETIKKAKQKVPCPYYAVKHADGTITILRK